MYRTFRIQKKKKGMMVVPISLPVDCVEDNYI